MGSRAPEPVVLTAFEYDTEAVSERTLAAPDECIPYRASPRTSWVNVSGVHDVEAISRIGRHFDIHPLVLEDILNTTKRPKFESYGDYLFVVLRMVYPDERSRAFLSEQVSLIIGRGYVLSFQEGGGDVFNPIRERLRQGNGRIRTQGADYLGYALFDAVIDTYFEVLERFGERLEELEERVISEPDNRVVRHITSARRTILALRRAAWSHRELASALERAETPLIAASTRPYLRDVYDHAVEIIDVIENQREIASAQMEMYLSSLSNRMNSVMMVLAVVSTIFMPLTFIAGVYGMNFKFMPELESPLGYPVVLGVMVLIAGGMVALFRRRGWI